MTIAIAEPTVRKSVPPALAKSAHPAYVYMNDGEMVGNHLRTGDGYKCAG